MNRRATSGLAAGAAFLFTSLPAAAQVLRGTVVDSVSKQPVTGATVTVLDTAGTDVSRAVTGEDGWFTFHLDYAGTLYLRVRRIGYASAVTEPIGVRPGVETIVRLPILLSAVSLETLAVRVEKVAVEQQVR